MPDVGIRDENKSHFLQPGRRFFCYTIRVNIKPSLTIPALSPAEYRERRARKTNTFLR